MFEIMHYIETICYYKASILITIIRNETLNKDFEQYQKDLLYLISNNIIILIIDFDEKLSPLSNKSFCNI